MSCEEAVEGQSIGKGGVKKPKLVKKKKAKKKMEKENDLVVSSQGSDSSSVKLRINSCLFGQTTGQKNIILKKFNNFFKI